MIGTITFFPPTFKRDGYSYATNPVISGQDFTCSGGETSGVIYDVVDNKNTSIVTVHTDTETTKFEIQDTGATTAHYSNYIIVDNHNLNDAGSDVRVGYPTYVNPTSAYAGTLGSELTAQTLNGNYVDLVSANGVLLINHALTASTSSTMYIEFQPNAAQIIFSDDIEIGEIIFGKSFTPAFNPEEPKILSNFEGVTVNRTWGGQKISIKRFGERKVWELNWPVVNESDKDEFIRVWTDCNGPFLPFYIDLGESTNPQLYYVRFVENSLQIDRLTNNAYKVSVKIEEEVYHAN